MAVIGRPEALEGVDLSPGSEGWRRLVSASKVPAIIGVSPWSSPLATWHEMKGTVDREEPSDDTVLRRGHYLEPAILAWWLDKHPEVENAQEQAEVWLNEWGMATLDLLAFSLDTFDDVIVEAKSTSSWDGWGDEGTSDIPPYYMAQVMWQLICCPSASRVYVAAIGPYLDFREYVVERHEVPLDDLLAKVTAFYRSLDANDPPPLDGHPATLETVSRLHFEVVKDEKVEIPTDLAVEYVLASLDLDSAEERLRAARAAVLDKAGRARKIVAAETGVYVARREQRNGGAPYLKRVAKTVDPLLKKAERV